MKYGAFDWLAFWDSLSMNFISLLFLAFAALVVALYYLFPKKIRWTVLLAGSIGFCAVGGWHTVAFPCLMALVAYFAAIVIEGTERKQRKNRRLVLTIGALILIGTLAIIKINGLIKWEAGKFIFPMGISYYTFSLVAYIADVYWGKDKAEKNYFKLLLFALFFPKILQGPIARHKTLGPQLVKGNSFDSKACIAGIQLMIWGYFKKMVIGDRLVMFTSTVFASYDKLGGGILLLNAVLSAFQLYADFSGCIDIARGLSQMLGITLEKNFDRPFSSKSAAELWRRWHITLGAWFKDYVMMPLAISPKLIKFCNTVGKRFGKRTVKALMTIIPTLIVWLLTGIWHGTGINYVLWGVYWAILMIVSSVFAPEIAKLAKLFRIDTTKESWKKFQVVRTFLLFCGGRVISTMPTPAAMGEYFARIFTKPQLWQFFDGTLFAQGLSELEFAISVVLVGLLIAVSCMQAKKSVRETIDGWNVVFRCAIYALALVLIFVFGIYGPSFNASSFAYMNF